MLLGDHVFDMECGRWRGEFGKVAVFAPMSGPFSNELTQ
jgi:hypothetical protein